MPGGRSLPLPRDADDPMAARGADAYVQEGHWD